MAYKITNKEKTAQQFYNIVGTNIIVEPKKSVIVGDLPANMDENIWKIEEIERNKETIEGGEIINETSERDFLISLKGIEDELADALLDRYENLESIKQASEEELAEIAGIGSKRAKQLKNQLGG